MVAVQPPPHCGPACSIMSVVVGLLRTPQIEDLVAVAQRSGIIICWWYHCVTAKHITSYLFTNLSMAVSPQWNGWGRGSKRTLTGPPLECMLGGHMLCFPVNLHPSSCMVRHAPHGACCGGVMAVPVYGSARSLRQAPPTCQAFNSESCER